MQLCPQSWSVTHPAWTWPFCFKEEPHKPEPLFSRHQAFGHANSPYKISFPLTNTLFRQNYREDHRGGSVTNPDLGCEINTLVLLNFKPTAPPLQVPARSMTIEIGSSPHRDIARTLQEVSYHGTRQVLTSHVRRTGMSWTGKNNPKNWKVLTAASAHNTAK